MIRKLTKFALLIPMLFASFFELMFYGRALLQSRIPAYGQTVSLIACLTSILGLACGGIGLWGRWIEAGRAMIIYGLAQLVIAILSLTLMGVPFYDVVFFLMAFTAIASVIACVLIVVCSKLIEAVVEKIQRRKAA